MFQAYLDRCKYTSKSICKDSDKRIYETIKSDISKSVEIYQLVSNTVNGVQSYKLLLVDSIIQISGELIRDNHSNLEDTAISILHTALYLMETKPHTDALYHVSNLRAKYNIHITLATIYQSQKKYTIAMEHIT